MLTPICFLPARAVQNRAPLHLLGPTNSRRLPGGGATRSGIRGPSDLPAIWNLEQLPTFNINAFF
jgi:hypothetical protein